VWRVAVLATVGSVSILILTLLPLPFLLLAIGFDLFCLTFLRSRTLSRRLSQCLSQRLPLVEPGFGSASWLAS
jgi:hypothetical protein